MTWDCNRLSCVAEFSIENRTSERIVHVMMLRAFRKRSVGNGVVVTDIVGEVKKDIRLFSKETRTFKERVIIETPTRVDLVSVSHYKPRD